MKSSWMRSPLETEKNRKHRVRITYFRSMLLMPESLGCYVFWNMSGKNFARVPLTWSCFGWVRTLQPKRLSQRFCGSTKFWTQTLWIHNFLSCNIVHPQKKHICFTYFLCIHKFSKPHIVDPHSCDHKSCGNTKSTIGWNHSFILITWLFFPRAHNPTHSHVMLSRWGQQPGSGDSCTLKRSAVGVMAGVTCCA